LPSTGQVGYLVLIKDAKIEEMADHTFAVQKGSPTVELGGHWPPAGIEALDPFVRESVVRFIETGTRFVVGHKLEPGLSALLSIAHVLPRNISVI
jgi:hypothetical protein